jgi:hypothetical protein
LFDGSTLGQNAMSGSIELFYRAGSEFDQGALFELIGFGDQPRDVVDGGKPLAELASATELEAAGSGWAFDPAAGGTVYVRVSAGEARPKVVR